MDNNQIKSIKDLTFDQKINLLIEFFSDPETADKKLTARTIYKGYHIGSFENRLRQKYYNNKDLKLDPYIEEKLLKLGVLREEKERETAAPLSWDEKYPIMEEYIKNCGVIGPNTIYRGYNLSQWQVQINNLYKSGKLSNVPETLINQYFELGILTVGKRNTKNKGNTQTTYEEKYEIFKKYFSATQSYGKAIPQDAVFEGHKIGEWQTNMRIRYYAGKKLNMSQEMIDKFLDLGVLRINPKNNTAPESSTDDIEIKKLVQNKRSSGRK